MNPLFTLFVFFFFLNEAWEIFLELINIRYLKKQPLPEIFQNTVTTEGFQKSIQYTIEKTYFGLTSRAFGIVFLWVFLLGGYFEKTDLVLQAHFQGLSLSVAYCFDLCSLETSIFYLFSICHRRKIWV